MASEVSYAARHCQYPFHVRLTGAAMEAVTARAVRLPLLSF